MNADTQRDLAIAGGLARIGVAILVARPAIKDGRWDPTGGTGHCGYWLPKGWQHTKPDPAVVDTWREGMALCAVMGDVLNALDADPRNGGDLARIPDLPRVWGKAGTPSDGTHAFITALGIAKDNSGRVAPGVDLQAGTPDGTGRGFVFIAPTRRRSKTDGQIRPYTWIEPPDFDRIQAEARDDTSGDALRGRVEAQRTNARPGDTNAASSADSGSATLAQLLADPPGGEDSGRNTWLTRVAGSYAVTRRDDEDSYRASVADANARLEYPLDDGEVADVARSIWDTERRNHPDRRSSGYLPSPKHPMRVARRLQPKWTEGGVATLRRWRGDWLTWRGTHWAEADDARIEADLWLLLEHADYQTNTGPEPWAPNKSKVANVLRALEAVTLLDREIDPPSQIDTGIQPPQVPISCLNGLLDVATRDLSPHTPGWFNFASVPFAFDPDAPEPKKWLEFLADLWAGDEQQVQALQEFFGYVLSGRTNQHKILLVVGPTRSGKSTIARILKALLGDGNAAAPTLASLTTQFGLAPLLGKPLAVVGDARLGRGSSTVVERLLSISGEDTIDVDRKYKNAWTGKLPTRFMLISNELPSFEDASGTIAHRFVLLTLGTSWLGREDHTLTDKLMAELPGILNWALDGLVRLEERGRLTEPESTADALLALKDVASPMTAFVRDRCEVGPDRQVRTDRLWDEWQSWCHSNGLDRPGTRQNFGRSLRAVVPQLRTAQSRDATLPYTGNDNRVRYYLGVGLRTGEPHDR